MPESSEQLELFPEPNKLPAYTFPIPSNAKSSLCSACKAEIVFATTPSGGQIPLALSTRRQFGSQWVATSHYRDCPFASAFSTRAHR